MEQDVEIMSLPFGRAGVTCLMFVRNVCIKFVCEMNGRCGRKYTRLGEKGPDRCWLGVL